MSESSVAVETAKPQKARAVNLINRATVKALVAQLRPPKDSGETDASGKPIQFGGGVVGASWFFEAERVLRDMIERPVHENSGRLKADCFHGLAATGSPKPRRKGGR